MADQIEVTSLAAQAASSIDSNTQVVAFTQSGDTNRLPFIEAVAESNSQNGCICIKEASLTIASADVLTLNSTPIEIIPAQGAGTAVEVIDANLKIVYNSAAYATNTDLQLRNHSADVNQFVSQIDQSADCFSKFDPELNVPDSIGFVENEALQVQVGTGNPTTGDSDITIYVTYRVITL